MLTIHTIARMSVIKTKLTKQFPERIPKLLNYAPPSMRVWTVFGKKLFFILFYVTFILNGNISFLFVCLVSESIC